jgi:hypothetical protein
LIIKKRKQYRLINEINNSVIEQLYNNINEQPIDSAWTNMHFAQRKMYDLWETIYLSIMEIE